MKEHEYALLEGVNRSKIGRYISLAAAGLSGAAVLAVLSFVNVAQMFGFPLNLPPVVLSLISASSVFVILYWIFDRYCWRWRAFSLVLNVPDLSGEWVCVGQTLNPDKSAGYLWNGHVTIVQTWDRIRVHLSTTTSSSDSVTAALLRDEVAGFRLLYNYRNNPAIGSTDLTAHFGFSELVFNKELTSASGEYFNGHGRFTFGTMKLTRT